MGLMQRAVETYDAYNHIVGRINGSLEILAPVGFKIATARVEITINKNAEFVSAQNIELKIPIPCTEKSSGRTSAPSAHPLCDTLEYVTDVDKEKHLLYLEELRNWAESDYSTQKIKIILKYVENNTIVKDLVKSKVIEIDEKGSIKNAKDNLVTWQVIGLGDNSGPVYQDDKIISKFTEYYISTKLDNIGTCMISGNRDILASQHLKGVSKYSANAKLISVPSSNELTYGGRFTDPKEALTIGYTSSQKAHNMLRWLITNEGVALGKQRVLVCWNPNGKPVPKINIPLLDFGMEKRKTNNIISYRKELEAAVFGYYNSLDKNETVVIAGFEAATSGRLSVTYYNELIGSDFLERLLLWDETCCWNQRKWGISSPSLFQIVSCAFGVQRGENDNAKIEVDDKIESLQIQRLISCRIDKKIFPIDIMTNIVNRVSNLQIYTTANKEKILFTACAVIRKCLIDNFKETYEMALEENKRDRSYQFGRLLAIMEKIEKDSYDSNESREANAIRLQSFFIQRPQKAFSQIMTQLKSGYYQKLSTGARIYYDKLIADIMSIISEFKDDEIDKPLSETYILGYYLQKNALYSKNENNNNNEE